MYEHRCNIVNAKEVYQWILKRGGVLVWESADRSNMSWATPATTETGEPVPQPSWRTHKTPTKHITDPKKIEVFRNTEVRRFKIAIKKGDSLTYVLTNFSRNKVRVACDLAGPNSTYEFDFETKEAVILVSEHVFSLAEWANITGLRLRMSQPKWKIVRQSDDEKLFVDETNAYPPEVELTINYKDCAHIFRYSLDRMKQVPSEDDSCVVYLVSEKWDKTWPHPIHKYQEWWLKDLSSVSNYVGIPLSEMVQLACSDNVENRASFYRAIGSYHGFLNLDQYPIITQNNAKEDT